jgi:transcriptional regulator with XRE-family HTH domain
MSPYRKMNRFTGEPMPHLGKMLQQILAEKRITKSELARRIGVHPSCIKQYILQNTLHAALLWKIGQALEIDFFAVLSKVFPLKKPTELEVSLQLQIADLKKENELYQKIIIAKAGN